MDEYKPVTAYRSKNGRLYENLSKCMEQDKIYETDQKQQFVQSVIENILQKESTNYFHLSTGSRYHFARLMSTNPHYIKQIYDAAFS